MNKSTCPKCKEEFTPIGFYSNATLCYDCETREKTKAMVLFIVIALSLVVGVRMLWAKFVYNDTRCTFAECRIQVNP